MPARLEGAGRVGQGRVAEEQGGEELAKDLCVCFCLFVCLFVFFQMVGVG